MRGENCNGFILQLQTDDVLVRQPGMFKDTTDYIQDLYRKFMVSVE